MSRRSASVKPGLTRAAPLFAALGDGTRLKLVARLGAEGPLSTVNLARGTGITRQALMKQLYALANAGLIEGTRRRPRVWTLKPARLEEARQSLDRIAAQWDAALDRLKDLVES